MKIWDITMTCDHKMLVAAQSAEEALQIAAREGLTHGAVPSPLPGEGPVDITPVTPGLLVWYPGPYSEDAILDEVE